LVPSTENLSLSCQTFFDEQFNVVVDFLDHLLEQVDTTIDLNIKGIKNNPLTCSGNQQSFTMKTHLKKPISLNTKNIPKPQIFFPEKIDNSNSPFVPKLKRKLNAASEDFTPIFDEETNSYAHPYEFELTTFTVSQKQMQEVVPQKFQDLKGSPIFYVDTLTTLQELCTYLQSVSEIAVDLEAHKQRSFSGFVCLMQISTRERDFLVDTLTLRAHIPLLLEVFTDSNIVKVFHGADMDIVWLQRDFGLYVVNMFDTGQAARVLGYPRYSLAYLLKHFCQVDADKQYQLADWRVRPLPEDMRRYAREDTHYLLYIYDCFKNELLLRSNESGNLLRAVWERSTSICLKKYEKSVWHEKKYQDLYLKYNRRYTKQQVALWQLHCKGMVTVSMFLDERF
jgi:exosome complex exonuclease RRP6